jgi:hypothetical protein
MPSRAQIDAKLCPVFVGPVKRHALSGTPPPASPAPAENRSRFNP